MLQKLGSRSTPALGGCLTFYSKRQVLVTQLYPTLCNPMDCSHEAPPPMGFSRQEYWSGLPFPSPGDLPNPGIEPGSPTLQADTLTSEPPGKPQSNSCDAMDCSLPGSSVHRTRQARILEWVAISFSRGSSQPRNQTRISYISCIGRRVLHH